MPAFAGMTHTQGGLGWLGVILLHGCISGIAPVFAVEPPAAQDIMRRVEFNQRIESEAVAFEMILTDKSLWP